MNTTQPTLQQLAQASLSFLERVQINGLEAETYLICRQWLRNIAAQPAPESAGRTPAPEKEPIE